MQGEDEENGGGGDKNSTGKGVVPLFFRVVNTKYKERHYWYLKLLESHRQGDKIRHRQLVNLSTLSQLPEDRIKRIFKDLTKTVALFKEVSAVLPPGYRYLKTPYLLALENSFKVPQGCHDLDLGETFTAGVKNRQNTVDESRLFDLIDKKMQEYGLSTGLIGWVENMASGGPGGNMTVCFLLNSSGFPLRYVVLERTKGDGTNILDSLQIGDNPPEFFLAPACERFYNEFRPEAPSEKENGYIFREIFLIKQLAGWPESIDQNLEKILLFGNSAAFRDDKINLALLVATDLKNHLDYLKHRLNPTDKGIAMDTKDLVRTCFISLFFKKVFDSIIFRHNLPQRTLQPRT